MSISDKLCSSTSVAMIGTFLFFFTQHTTRYGESRAVSSLFATDEMEFSSEYSIDMRCARCEHIDIQVYKIPLCAIIYSHQIGNIGGSMLGSLTSTGSGTGSGTGSRTGSRTGSASNDLSSRSSSTDEFTALGGPVRTLWNADDNDNLPLSREYGFAYDEPSSR